MYEFNKYNGQICALKQHVAQIYKWIFLCHNGLFYEDYKIDKKTVNYFFHRVINYRRHKDGSVRVFAKLKAVNSPFLFQSSTSMIKLM